MIKKLIVKLKNIFSTHEHNWQLVTKTVSDPKTISSNVFATDNDLGKEFWDKYIFGITTFIWECQECGEIKTEDVLGTDTPALDEILDRVDMYGSQPIRRDGVVYIVTYQQRQQIDERQLEQERKIPVK